MELYEKRGYLDGSFKLFHLSDTNQEDIAFHYHDFDKVIIFLKGDVDYMVEGRSYRLIPYDIVLVRQHQIHRPVIRSQVPYERIIIYFSPHAITSFRTPEYDLEQCLLAADEQQANVLRVKSMEKSRLWQIISNLEDAGSHDGYANQLYCQTLFLEFMIFLNRAALESRLEYSVNYNGNQKILDMLAYIHGSLTEDLSIDTLSQHFFLSKYHMMRLFKQETGYTISNYINEKRLLLARERLNGGQSITQTCYDCGFKNYSAFLRAYKKLFGQAPAAARRAGKS